MKSSLWGHLRHMQKLALPTIWTREGCGSMVFIVLFAVKAFANVMKSEADGRVIETMVAVSRGKRPQMELARGIARFSTAVIVSSGVSSAIEHLRFWLIASYRERLTTHFHTKFFDRLTFYYGSQLDDRLEAADTVIPVYCHEFAEHFAELPYYFVMPFFEALTALVVVVRRLGVKPAGYLIGTVTLSLLVLRALTPPFGKIHSLLLNREEAFRKTHTDVHANVEQVAFLSGGGSVRERANRSFMSVAESLKHMACAKGHFQLVEGAINGGWEIMGLLLSNMLMTTGAAADRGHQQCSLPHRGSAVSEGSSGGRHLLSAVVVQRRLVQDFHQAVTALVVNVKEVSHLSEFTEKLALFDSTLDSVARGELVIKRNIVDRQLEDQQARLGTAGATGIESGELLDATAVVDEPDAEDSLGGDDVSSPAKGNISGSGCSLQTARDTWQVPELHRTRSEFAAAEGIASDNEDRGELAAPHRSPVAEWDVSRLSPALGQASYVERSVVSRPPGVASPLVASLSMAATPPLAAVDLQLANSPPSPATGAHANTPVLARLSNVTVANPHGRVLIPNLSMSIREGDRWAIIGPNGSGKSSILRVLAKLWLPTTGVIETSRSVRYLFLPQSPYFPPSTTLAEQLTFPHLPKLVVDTFRRADIMAGSARSDLPSSSHVLAGRHLGADALCDAFGAISAKYGDSVDRLTAVMGSGLGLAAPTSIESVGTAANIAGEYESPEEVLRNNAALREQGVPLTVCPKQQRRMREAMSLATASQFLEEVFGGWGSPVAGLLDPHLEWSGEDESVATGGTASSSSPSVAVVTSLNASSSATGRSPWLSASETLAVGADRSFDWYSLSGGQQQKLSLARAFYHILRYQEEGDASTESSSTCGVDTTSSSAKKPTLHLTPDQLSPIIVMDESTSQMDFMSENRIFKHLAKKGVTLVSVTHRPEVIERHDHILEIIFEHAEVPASNGAGRTQSIVVPRWAVRRQ